MAVDYLLYESSVGYAIFKVVMQPDTVGNRLKEVQESTLDLARFGKMVQVVSFAPFQGAAQALENINNISEGIAPEYLITTLEVNLPKSGKKNKVTLGVQDKNLAGSIKGTFPKLEFETGDTNEVVADLLRGLRLHGPKLLKQLQDGDIQQAQLGLGHAYSRARVKYSVQKNDNHIIQAIATLDQLDKDVNTFSMRVREWYSWHFPELVKIVSDNQKFAKVALFIQDKSTLTEDKLHDLAALVDDDESVARSIIQAGRVSMGRDMMAPDMENFLAFAKRAVALTDYRKQLYNYLSSKMGIVAPNVAALIGDVVGARLIQKAGSLTNLCKYPASTVQILGAEKALFRALKTKGNTPKYGLIYHSSFIGRAGPKNKGRISRFVANKVTIASRIDNFSEKPTTVFGEALRKQVEQRLDFYATGTPPTKNTDVMKSAMDKILADINIEDDAVDAPSDVEMADSVTADSTAPKKVKEKKDKKSKKRKGEKVDAAPISETLALEEPENMDVDADSEVEKKKSKKEKREKKEKGDKKEKKRKHTEVNGEGGVKEKGKKKKKRHSE